MLKARAQRFQPWTLVVLLAALWFSGRAQAQVDAQIGELNSQALDAYQALDIETARSKLEQAIGMAQQTGYAGRLIAQTYMNLGVVLVAGDNEFDQGLAAFLSAICSMPDVQLDPLLSTPNVQLVFGQAQRDARNGACGPGAGGQTPPQQHDLTPTPGMMAPAAAGPRADEECPPGVVCNGGEGGSSTEPNGFARFFFNVQLAEGFAYVQPGMKADSKPPVGEIFDTDTNVPTDSNNDGSINEQDDLDMNRMIDTADRRDVFNIKSAWVPDADSFDDYMKWDPNVQNGQIEIRRGTTPAAVKCTADGKPSGPLDLSDPKSKQPFTTLEPSSYCVRVVKSGVVANLALRFNPGYFVTRSFALSVPLRFQFDAGKGSMSHMLIGLRGEYMFTDMKTATGTPVSWFFGGTYGQIQAKPPPKGPKRAAPYVISGLFGLHTGFNVRLRIHGNFGFIISPEVDVQLPDFMFNGDLAGGVEAAF